MQIIVGSKNRTKVLAVKNTFPDATVIAKDLPSQVSAQPFGEEETLQGAVNRAKAAQQYNPSTYGIGLEGGVYTLEDELFLCSWGVLATPNGRIYKASGARIELPQEFLRPLKEGVELSELMNAYTKRHDIRHHEGAIGIFTQNLLRREEMFRQVVQLLKGQWLYGQAHEDSK